MAENNEGNGQAAPAVEAANKDDDEIEIIEIVEREVSA